MSAVAKQPRQGRSDEGVTLILIALALVAILVVVALVIDYGNVRSSRQGNKLTTDVVASAGLQRLAPEGIPLPWQAVCSSLDYLEVNEPELVPFTITYEDGAGNALPGDPEDPCADATLLAQACVPNTSTTWAWIHAVSGDRAFDIRSGYTLPDPAFPEDAAEYAGDTGAPAQGGCDHLAVITSRTDDAIFGGIADATSYSTTGRTVGRVEIGQTGPVAIALVLLEQEDCQALNFAGGGGTGEIMVKGTGVRPGIIHSDSSGDLDNGDNCNADRTVIVGKQNSGPRVRALAAPGDPNVHGILSTYAKSLGANNDANWTPSRTANETEVWMCDPDDGVTVGPSPCQTDPVGNARVTRTPADDRYLTAITDRRNEANVIFNQMPGTPTGYIRYTSVGGDCDLQGGDPPVTITPAVAGGTRLYIDCPELRIAGGKSVVIAAGITHVAFQGTTTHGGDGLLDIRAPEEVLVRGGSGAAINTGAQGRLRINADIHTDPITACDDRRAAAPFATTEMVIANGALAAAGGGSTWMCSTSLHLMGGTTSASPVDTSSVSYPAPYNNTQNGFFEVGGGSGLLWTAPNTVLGEPTVGSYRFEDLAVWTETQHNNKVNGGGVTRLVGVFFLPNTGPDDAPGGLQIGGTTSSVIQFDAQLWVRKLDHNGGPVLSMRANPADSIKVPFLAGVGLVR